MRIPADSSGTMDVRKFEPILVFIFEMWMDPYCLLTQLPASSANTGHTLTQELTSVRDWIVTSNFETV